MSNRLISVAIPHYNNSRFMNETLQYIISDDRISEIIICDDVSKDIQDLETLIKELNCQKITLYKNNINLGCYHNKLESISKCSNDWAILLDSDNVINTEYIDTLFNIENWDSKFIYSPSFAKTFPGEISPYLNYESYVNKTISKDDYLANFDLINFQCLINNCNYFLPVKEYNNCMAQYSSQYDRTFIDSLDSAVLFTDWICNNNYVTIVKGLEYNHRSHPNSNYVLSNSKVYEHQVRQLLYNKVKQI